MELVVFALCATAIACTFLVCKLLAAKSGVPYFDDHPLPMGPPEWVVASHKTTTTYAPPPEPDEPEPMAETEETT